jgi:cellulose biosynthesis protein BcsQ
MSTLFISPKGGNCTTVTASAYALVSAMRGTNTLLIDLCGDVPAAIGLPEHHGPGINDWLNEDNVSDAQQMVLLGTPVIPGLVVLHRGARFVSGEPRWEALAEAIGKIPHDVIIDAGTTYVPESLTQAVSNVSMVVRPCYLSLRRASRMTKPQNVFVIKEENRALTVKDVGNVLGVPIAAEIPYDAAISRAVDAGLLTARAEQLFGKFLPHQ